jgi:short-subunit dehydrogenase
MIVRDSVVVVTGASAGIGRATAVLLAKAGANVIVTARREDRLAILLQELNEYGGRHLAVAGDIGEVAFAQLLLERTVSEFGRLDVLVNNAGVGHRSSLAETAPEHLQAIWATNVFGLVVLTQTAVAHMKQQGQGHIINVSSILGQRPMPGSVFYAASKTAVNFISRGLRMELKAYNIKVTTLYPGLTATEFAQARFGQKDSTFLGLKGVSAERVGRAIVRGIENGRTEIYITWYDWLFAHLCRLFPRTFDWFIQKIAQQT